jgi:hypothetical protein
MNANRNTPLQIQYPPPRSMDRLRMNVRLKNREATMPRKTGGKERRRMPGRILYEYHFSEEDRKDNDRKKRQDERR